MVRPSIDAKARCSQYELKTLKISKDTLEQVRKPFCWSRPNSGLYDYHYEIGGLYYQPLVRYCMDRVKGGARRQVDMPDRMQTNFDKRAYQLTPDACDYEGFLTDMYVRRMRDENRKTIHCANELYTKSKENTILNDVTNAAQYRDKYVCQIQLQHTGNVAKEENLLRKKASWSQEEMEMMSKKGRETSEEKEQKMIRLGIHKDARYGPGFKKVSSIKTQELDWDPLGEFFPTSKVEEAVSDEEQGMTNLKQSTSTETVTTSSSKKIVKTVSGQVTEERSDTRGGKPMVTKELLEADNMKDWLRIRHEEDRSQGKYAVKDVKPMYIDTGYAKALDEVKERVKRAGVDPGTKIVTAKNFNYFFGDRKAEDIGSYTKAAIHTNMYTMEKIPEFDVGYDTIKTIADAKVM